MTNAQGFLWNILLALAWAAITGRFDLGNLVIGFGVGLLIMFMLRRFINAPNYFQEVRQVIMLILFVVWQLILSNIRVAWDVVTPRHYMKPGVIAVPTEAKTEAEITLLAGIITLTPGSITVDVSTDRRVIYIHAMYVDDVEALSEEIKGGYERRLLEVLR